MIKGNKYYTYCRVGNKEKIEEENKKEKLNEQRNYRKICRRNTI